MDAQQKVLFVGRRRPGIYRVAQYAVGDFFGPVDLGLHLAGRYDSLNIGVGLLAGSIFPGSNRLIFTGFSPCWGGFYISSMGGAGLVFDNLGVNMVSMVGPGAAPSVLVSEPDARRGDRGRGRPVELPRSGPAADRRRLPMDDVDAQFGERYRPTRGSWPWTGGAGHRLRRDRESVPIAAASGHRRGHLGGPRRAGSKCLADHNIAAIIYGGTVADEDFRTEQVADEWFQARYQKKLAAKDIESTTKYRFDPSSPPAGPSASTSPPRRAASSPSTIAPSTGVRRSGSRSTRSHRRSTTSSSSTTRLLPARRTSTAASPAGGLQEGATRSSRRTTSRTRPWDR